jgi:hypothetical protein
VDYFSNQTEHDWTVQSGTWQARFTEYRGQLTTRRGQFFYEAGVVTHGAPGPTPIYDWRSVVRICGRAGVQGHTPQILAVRHNVTALKEGFGLEINFSTSGADQIRLVRYGPNYGTLPALAAVDTTLSETAWYVTKFSVLHTPLGVELKAKVWPGADPEPEPWNLEALSTFIVSGPDFSIGALGTFSDPFVAIDYVMVLGDRTPIVPTSWGRIKRVFR